MCPWSSRPEGNMCGQHVFKIYKSQMPTCKKNSNDFYRSIYQLHHFTFKFNIKIEPMLNGWDEAIDNMISFPSRDNTHTHTKNETNQISCFNFLYSHVTTSSLNIEREKKLLDFFFVLKWKRIISTEKMSWQKMEPIQRIALNRIIDFFSL